MTTDKDGGARSVVRDQVFQMHDGWRCFVNGQEFGSWRSRAEAYIGMEVEQRRAAARTKGEG